MKSETIAIHSGYEPDPTTKAVAVPIYQTVAYAFDSADTRRRPVQSRGRRLPLRPHQQSDHRRAGAPRRGARGRRRGAVRGDRAGGAELRGAQCDRAGHQHRLGAPALRHDPHAVRPRAAVAGRIGPLCRERPACRHREAHRRRHPRGVLRDGRKSGRQHLRYRGAGRASPTTAASRSSSTTRWRRRSCSSPSTTAPTSWCTRSPSSWAGMAPRWAARSSTAADFRGGTTPPASRCSARPTLPITASSMSTGSGRRPMSRAAAASTSAPPAPCSRRSARSCCSRASRRWRCGSSAMSRMRRRVAEHLRGHPRVAWVNYAGFSDSPYHALANKYLGGRACSLLTFGVEGGYDGGEQLLRCAPARQAPRQYRRRQIARLPPGLDDPSPDVGGRAGGGGRTAGNDPAQRRHRAHRRHHRGPRPGARRHGDLARGNVRGSMSGRNSLE